LRVRVSAHFNDNSILGTIDFISPEQTVIGGKLDIRSDIHCLGPRSISC